MKAIFSSARTKSGKTSCTLYHKVHGAFWLVLCVVMSLLFSCRGGKAGGGSKLTPEDSAEIAMLLDSAKSVSGQDYLRLLAISKETEKLAIAKKDTASWAEALSNEVLAYFHMGVPDSALIVSRTQIHLDSLLGEISYLSSDYSNIASICLSTHQLVQAKNYIDRAIELEKQVKDHPNLSIRYGVASEIYNSLELRDKALSFAKQAYDLDMARKDTLKAGRRLSQMGDIYFAMPDFEAAHRCYRQAVEWLEAKGERHSLGLTYQHLGDMLIQQKKPAEAIPYFERAIAISREIHSRRQEMQACKGLAQAYHSTGKDALAYEQYEAFSILKDSVFSSETSRQLSELQVRYESAEKDLQLLSQQKRLGSMRNLTIGLLLGIFILLSIVGVLYAFNRIRAKNNLLLKKLEEIRSNFFTNITHEFRTPLTIIIGLVERMQKSREALPKQCAADMMTIQQQSNELLNLVNQLLDYSKVKSAVGMGAWVTGDIRPVVSMAVEVQQSYATAKGITLTFAMADKPVMTDYVADYLNKVLRNLLSNAIKFTSSGGRILVTLKDDDQHVVLRIADTGCGIPRDDLRFIFNPFYQTKSGQQNKMGTGIGLSLSYNIVEAMNGSLTVKSREGTGSVFTVRLPKTAPEGITVEPAKALPEVQYVPEPEPVPQTETRPIILVAEDHPELLEYIRSLLADRYDILLAHDGAEALQIAKEKIPDLILTDIMMPKMSGDELCRAVNGDELLSHIPIVVITAREGHEERIATLQEGAVSYIVKPFHADELNLRIDNIIRQMFAQRERYRTALEQGKPEPATLSGKDQKFLNQLNQLIVEQMAVCNATTEAIADRLCISNQQLRRKISSITGETGAAYIAMVRLQTAKRLLLEEPDMSIEEVAHRCGYDDSNYFSRAFKKRFGIVPSAVHKNGE